jgi:DNA-binding transcriptional MerR regulator
MNKKDELPELLTLKQTCEILQVHPNTLRQWDDKGILKAVRFGARKDRKYRRLDIEKLISNKHNK